MPSSPGNKKYPAVTIAAGDWVYRPDDVGSCMYLISEGAVEVFESADRSAIALALFERGDFFGEMAILSDGLRGHAVRARDESRLVEIDRPGFSRLLKRNPEITIRMIRKLAHRLDAAESSLVEAWATELDEDATINSVPLMARLIHLDGEREGAPFRLPERAEIAIGRADPTNAIHPDIDLAPIDAQLSTSRRHARILRRERDLWIVEVQSTNGTFVDGHRLAAGQPVALSGGEEIRFGGVRMRFEIGTPTTNRQRPAAVEIEAMEKSNDDH